jgi:23S rRNA pseudouridine1911/1915/1917 synthase
MSNTEISRAERLDQYVAKRFPMYSRAFAAKLIDEGKVSVNGEPITKAGYKLRAEDTIIIDYEVTEQPPLPTIELPILYEDNDCVVINKPVGVLSHSKGNFNPEATVASWLASRVTSLTGSRAGIVHRLDRATSGVMICAKSPEALAWLQKQFSKRNVKKTYIAVVQGTLTNEQAVIDMPIERNPKKPQTFRVGANGKPAITTYRVLTADNGLSLVELQPQTGRTHQLRVHLSQLGHPIVGDTLYAGRPAERLYLHAEHLEITLPNRERRIFEAPVPDSFQELLHQ